MRLCIEVPHQPRSAPFRFGEFMKTPWPTVNGGTIPRWLYAPRGKVLYWTDGQEDDFNRVASRVLQEGKKYGINPVVVAIPDEVPDAEPVVISDTVIDFSQPLTEAQRETAIAWLKQEAAKASMPLPPPSTPAPAPAATPAPTVETLSPSPSLPVSASPPSPPAKKPKAKSPPKPKPQAKPKSSPRLPVSASPPSPAGPGGTF